MPLVGAGQFTIIDVNDGVTSSLSNESAVLAASSAGTVASYTGAETQFKVIEGGADTTSAWSYYISGTGGGISYRDSDDAADRTGTGMAAGALGGANLVSYSEYNAATWSLPYSGPTISTGVSDPYGGADAMRIALTGLGGLSIIVPPGFTADGTSAYTMSFWCRLVSGTATFSATIQGEGFGSSYNSQLITGTWVRVAITAVPSAGSKTYIQPLAATSGTTTLEFFGVQLEVASSASALTRTSGSVASGTRGYVRVSALTQDLSYLDITAVKAPGTTITRRFSVAKARQGVRGTITTSRAITGTAWSDSEANSAIVDAGGISPIQGDVVTLYNSSSGFSQTRVYTAAGAWSALAGFFGGDVLVNGTLTAQKIVAEGVTRTRRAQASTSWLATNTWHNLTSVIVPCDADGKRTIIASVGFADESALNTPNADGISFGGYLRIQVNGTTIDSYEPDGSCKDGFTTQLSFIYMDETSRSGSTTFVLQGRVVVTGKATTSYRKPTLVVMETIR